MSVDIDFNELVKRFVEQNRHVPEIQFVLKDLDAVKIHEIQGGGIVNYIIRVQSEDGLYSVILKHGLGHARCIPELKLSLERQTREYNALKLMDRIIPGSVPKPYCFDSENHIICMEDLRGMEILGDDLRKGEINLKIASNIGKTLAQMHTATSKRTLTKEKWQQLETLFNNRDDVDVVIDNHSNLLFQEDSTFVTLPEAVVPVFKKNARLLLSENIDKKLKEKMELRECFIHADCHWMSMFTNEERIALFDFEFGHLGNPNYNLGWTTTSYYICMLEASTKYPLKVKAMRDRSEEAFKAVVNSYCKEISPIDGKPGMDFPTVTLFCGNIMFFFSVLVGGQRLITLTDEQKCHLINLGTSMMLKSEDFTCLDDLTQFIFHSQEGAYLETPEEN